MRIATAILTFIPLSALASSDVRPRTDDNCLGQSDATTIVNNYVFLISQWASNPTYSEQLADATVSDTITDYSDSVATLVSNGSAIGPQPLYPNRTAWEAGQADFPVFEISVENVWFNCETVIARWFTVRQPLNVTGIFVLETIPAPEEKEAKRLVNTVYSEFNSGAWLSNTHALTSQNCSTASARRLAV